MTISAGRPAEPIVRLVPAPDYFATGAFVTGEAGSPRALRTLALTDFGWTAGWPCAAIHFNHFQTQPTAVAGR